jgi:phosphate starvation-inducible PhoH-like protein
MVKKCLETTNMEEQDAKTNMAVPSSSQQQQQQQQEKKKYRKPRKISEKEIMKNFYLEKDDFEEMEDSEKQETHKKTPYHYLSANEKKKIKEKFTKPKNPHQEALVQCLKLKSNKIIFITGPAGTGKTLFATEYGIHHFLTGTYDKIVFTRPSVSVDEDLGYLPGTLEEKMAPWIRPIYDILYHFVSPKEVQTLIEDKAIEIAPLGFMRGRTFKNTWIVADEMQNSTISQMKMLLTRLGENSRLIITGDLEQFDRIRTAIPELNGLEDFLMKFRNRQSNSIVSIEFDRTDIQREEVVKEILDIYHEF